MALIFSFSKLCKNLTKTVNLICTVNGTADVAGSPSCGTAEAACSPSGKCDLKTLFRYAVGNYHAKM